MADYRKLARSAALKHGVDPNIFERQIAQESGFNPNARSPAGAEGIAQFMPATAAGLGINPHDPIQALNGAAQLMSSYVRKYGSYHDALVAYNAGPGRVGKALPAETQHYVATILGGSSPQSRPGATSVLAQQMAGGPSMTSTSEPDTVKLALANLLASQGQNAHNNPLFASGVLSTNPQDMVKTVLAARAGTGPASTHPGVQVMSSEPMGHGGLAYPLAHRGKIIGTPYTGTHTLGNWQSDNAIDISTPVGTPVRSIEDGVVVKVSPHPQDGGRFAGDQVTIRGNHGGTFYTHLSGYQVHVGQHVRRGQVVGRSGSANGVAHLHIGREQGNPLKEFG